MDDNYTLSTAEELANKKNKVRQERNEKLNGRDRKPLYGNPAAQRTEGLKVSRPIRVLEADQDDLNGVDLRRVRRMTDVLPAEDES